MANALVQQVAKTGSVAFGTLTFGATPTAGNLIVLIYGCVATNAATLSSVAGYGATWTKAKSSGVQADLVEIWWGIASGSATAISATKSVGGFGAIAVEFSGIKNATPVDVTSTNTGTAVSSTISSGTVNTIGSSDLIVVGFSCGTAVTYSSGPTNSFNRLTTPVARFEAGYILNQAVGSYSTSNTMSGNTMFDAAIVAFIASGTNNFVAPTTSDTVSLVESTLKSTSRTLTDALTLLDVLNKTLSRVLSESISMSDVLTKQTQVVRLDILSILDSVTKNLGRSLTDVVSLLDNISRQFSRSVLETVQLVETLNRFASRSVSDALVINEVVLRGIDHIDVSYLRQYLADVEPTLESGTATQEVVTYEDVNFIRQYLGDVPPVVEEGTAVQEVLPYDDINYIKDYLN